MALIAGRDILLKVSNNAQTPTFIIIGGLRARNIKFNSKTIDATSSDSAGNWRELIPNAGLKEVNINGSGVLKNSQSNSLLREIFFLQDVRDWQLIITGFGILTGKFAINTLEYGGNYDSEATFSIELNSAGEIGFSAL